MSSLLLSLALLIALLLVFWVEAKAGLKLFGRGGQPEAARPEARHLAGLDGLRGILALSVFVHHASCVRNLAVRGSWYPQTSVLSQAGTYAVTLFFFITGFLFWAKLQKDPRPSIRGHLRSRIFRLGPAYWASVLVVFAIAAWLTGGERREPWPALLKHVGNWIIFTIPGRSDINGLLETSRIDASVTWTLRLEWVFYVIVPFCGWFALKFWRTALLLLGLVVWGKVIAPQLHHVAHFAPLVNFSDDIAKYLMTVFSGGIFAAAVRPWLIARFPKVDFRHFGFSLLGLALIAGVIVFGPVYFGAVETLWLIVPFILIVLGNDWSGFLTSAPAIFLGKISYSIYLLHGIVLFVTWKVMNHIHPLAEIPSPLYWLFIGALGSVVIAVSALWYRWFEAPFLHAAKTKKAPQPAPAAAEISRL